MAEIYKIGSDDLIDRVSTFGGTNLARSSDYDIFGADTYNTKTNVTFLGNNKIKIDAGGKLGRSNTNYTQLPIIVPSLNKKSNWHFFVYENTLNEICKFQVGIQYSSAGSGLTSINIPVNGTGLYIKSATYDNIYGIYISLIDASSATSGYIILGPLKYEIGTKPTDWTPCPYDLVTYNSTNSQLVFFQ